MWRDEIQAWSIAVKSYSIFELWKNSAYEGHPKLWFVLLYALKQFTCQLERADSLHTLVATKRYDEFRDAMLRLARTEPGVELREIAGNDDIFLTGIAPSGWDASHLAGLAAYALPLPTDSTRERVAVRVKVRELLPLLRQLEAPGGLVVDHIYDY